MATVKSKKKRGPPATGKTPVIALRIPDELVAMVDAWAKAHGVASRSEAIRKILEATLRDGKK